MKAFADIWLCASDMDFILCNRNKDCLFLCISVSVLVSKFEVSGHCLFRCIYVIPLSNV